MSKARQNIEPSSAVAIFVASGLALAIGLGIRAYLVEKKKSDLKAISSAGPSTWERQILDKSQRALTWSDYDGNCTGYVGSIFRSLGFNIVGDVRMMAAKAKRVGAWHKGVPRVGDIVFFDNTWDKNGNGLLDDYLSHVGVVMDVSPSGRVVFGHGGTSGGRAIGYLSVLDPNTSTDSAGMKINTTIRAQKMMDPLGTKYLAGQLVAGFATVRPEDKDKWNAA